MKKTVRTLHLGKETLQRLSSVTGGAVGVITPSPISQEGDSCVQSCYFNTCYDTCQWQAVKGLN
jgi:hypothetical protein